MGGGQQTSHGAEATISASEHRSDVDLSTTVGSTKDVNFASGTAPGTNTSSGSMTKSKSRRKKKKTRPAESAGQASNNTSEPLTSTEATRSAASEGTGAGVSGGSRSNSTSEDAVRLMQAIEAHPPERVQHNMFDSPLDRAHQEVEGRPTIPGPSGEGEASVGDAGLALVKKKRKAKAKAREAVKGPVRGVLEWAGQEQLALTDDFAMCMITEMSKREDEKKD